MEISTLSTDNSYENTGGTYTGLTLTDNHEYSTLEPTSNPIPEAQITAKSRHNCAPYKMATVCLGLLCASLVIVIITLCAYLEAPTRCPQGFVPFISRCYYFSTVKKNWVDSQEDCKAHGADLVVIETKEEQVFIHNHWRGELYWIGLTDSATEGTWLWVDGSQPNVWFWKDGEPNSYKGREENCIHGFSYPDPLKSWNDIECHVSFYWVCEAKPQ